MPPFSVPMKLPVSKLLLVPTPPISMPSTAFAEITFPLKTLPLAPDSTITPDSELGMALVPVASVPMKLPWILLRTAVLPTTYSPASPVTPEITLPWIVLFEPLRSMPRPLGFAPLALPPKLVPT